MTPEPYPQPDEVSREHLEAEVERLRAQLAERDGRAARAEQDALRRLLYDVRRASDALPMTSEHLTTLRRFGFFLARTVDGEHSTVEEFAAEART